MVVRLTQLGAPRRRRREPPCENQAVCARAQAWATRRRGPSNPRSPSSRSHCEASASRPGGASVEDLPFSARRTMSAALSASFASFVDLNVSIPRAMILPRRSDVASRANNASRRFDTASVFRQISNKASTRLCLLTRGSCAGGAVLMSPTRTPAVLFSSKTAAPPPRRATRRRPRRMTMDFRRWPARPRPRLRHLVLMLDAQHRRPTSARTCRRQLYSTP